jgi:hypothetical protein
MNIAKRLAIYGDKGFSRERSEINVLMEAAALAIFRDFPEAFVLFGGATLVLYHDSMRHSADLDRRPRERTLRPACSETCRLSRKSWEWSRLGSNSRIWRTVKLGFMSTRRVGNYFERI